jgi:predicted nucleic acid-binding protein
MTKVMFDTNAFDRLPEVIGLIRESAKPYEYYITTIQIDELCEIPDSKLSIRKRNILMLADLRAHLVPLSVFILNGRVHLGYARLGNGKVYREILNKNKSNIEDAAIADTAVYEGCILITNDDDLYCRVVKHGYQAMKFDDFIKTLQS